MNRITTPTLAWLLSATLLLIAGCSREAEIPGTLPPAQQDKVITVPLNIDVQTLRPQTKAPATERIIATERTDNMLVELVATPDAPATRAFSEDAISNFWLLQFDAFENKDANTKLLKKTYYDIYAGGMGVELIVRNQQRLVVLVNTFDPELGDRFQLGMNYQTLLNTYKPLAGNGSSDLLTNGGNNVPMSGFLYLDINDNTVGNQPLSITLRPTLAKLNVSVRNGNIINPVKGSWNIQLCNVPNSYYLVPPWTDGVIFPAPGMPVSNYPEQAISNLLNNDFTTVLTNCYFSPNMRGTVAGCTATQRPAKAPEGATYIKISGIANSTKFYTYTLHLGQNLTTDFNLLSNWSYTYRLTLYDNAAGNDGRVEVTDFNYQEVEYVGMYGGELKKDGAGVWQFTKKLYVQNTDERGGGEWATTIGDYSALAGDKVPNYTRDGRQNTWNLNKGTGGSLTDFPTANACYKKSGNPTSVAGLTWYLPAQDQLLAVYLTAKTLNTQCYWSATETLVDPYYGGGGMSFRMDSPIIGAFESQYETDVSAKIRCVREL